MAPMNRLSQESSPYLRQHAANPVDWYPWGPEALARAQQLDRPIFLSIGYSACHWCHVMEHESFEDPGIAGILNEHFVSIKVDREERPDLDQIYMAAVQMLTGQGGWPMSVFLTPQLQPFTGGTYFPPEDRYGRPGFRRILLALAEAWKIRRQEISQAAEDLTQHLQQFGQLGPSSEQGDQFLQPTLLRNASHRLARSFDRTHGGFGSAPKFLHTMDLRLLLRVWQRFNDDDALGMVRLTLDRMAMGGIYDHLGGGFARYSTDDRWLVPHFEKMLYDNALLVVTYLEAYQATKDLFYREIVEETLDWVIREMTSPQGAFYSTLDADSEGEEGKFYVWTAQEIEQILGPEQASWFGNVYCVQSEGNWEDPHHPGVPKNILHRTRSFLQDARLLGVSEDELKTRLQGHRRALSDVRTQRIPPGKDDKVLTSWNGLMITAFAFAAQVLARPEYATAAVRASEFLLTQMRQPDGRLFRTWSAGCPAKLNAYLEDYAFLLEGLVTLYETTFDSRWIASALDLARVMDEQFWDNDQGGYFYTGKDHETLIARGKDPHDNATPSGNAVAVTALLRLLKLTGDNGALQSRLRERAERTLHLYAGLMTEHPRAASQMLLALDFWLGPVHEYAVIGESSNAETQLALQALRADFRPHQVVAQVNPSQGAPAEVPLLAHKKAEGGQVTIYRCENFTCQEPVLGVEALTQLLASK